ncbi:unnamed protein product [Adineta steineri]|uniref:EF-hand domain-containing protein n=1 Tax=Adineta steineri TaxID=433720 RepID=A0A814EYG0_9BILA|nr:unnamed protein product [Adineta steineri]CAF4044913.1 unnamed protein product [Adineta steineri]
MASSVLIERQAIGRSGSIGSLYDIRTDQFVMGNLFNDVLPDAFIKRSDCANVSYWLDFHSSQKETFNNLNIEANLKLALMAGLLKVEGSAKYLKQTKTNSHTVRATFLYKAKTKQEDLQVSTKGLHEYFSSHAFENPDATHVVIGIKWGANVAATFEREVEKNDDVKRIEGRLAATFTKPAFSITGDASLKYDKEQKADLESLTISFSGDVLIENCPRTIDGVMEVYQNVPSMIKSLNDGKGQQLTFILCSLKQIAEMTKFERNITRMVKEVSEQIVNRIENIFEKINEEQRKLNDFLDDINPWREFLPRQWFDLVKQKLSNFNEEELKLKRDLSSLLVDIRSNRAEESKMIELIDNFSKHPCSPESIEKFFYENEKIKTKIKTLKRISPDKKELLTNITSVEDFIQDFYDDDVYLLHICEKWQEEDEENSLKQMRYFINLKKKEQETENSKAKFWVIDYDLHSRLKKKPANSVIYYATKAAIKSKDFYKESLKKLSRKQIDLILIENSTLTEQRLKEWHKQFMNDHPDGELDEEDFICELGKLFPKGDPANFGDFVFQVIDKDKSGKINFPEFMTAVAITHPGDLTKRLHLVFSFCDYDCSENIGAQKIIKFIEAITELNNGSSAVNTNEAKSTAEQIMKFCHKNKDDMVTEEEFIRCCKRNSKIAKAFLPDVEVTEQIKWKQNGIICAGGNRQGNQLNQLYLPHGIFIDHYNDIFIADTENHRIVEWKYHLNKGQIIVGRNGQGKRDDQLNTPTDVLVDKKKNSFIIADQKNRQVIRCFREDEAKPQVLISDIYCYGLSQDKNGFIYISDIEKNEVRRWKEGDIRGTIVAGGHGQGNHPNQLNSPRHIFVDEDESLYVADTFNHRVMKWTKNAKEGVVVAGGNGQGDSLKQLSRPHGMTVDDLGQIYVADWDNHRVMRWCEGKAEGEIVVGGNGKGEELNQLDGATGLSFDDEGNLYIADTWNHRILKYEKCSD